MVTSKVRSATQVIEIPQDAFPEIFRKPPSDTSFLSTISMGSGAVDPHLCRREEVQIYNIICGISWSEGITKKLKALEEVIGLLNDLTNEELESFDNAVKRRPLFKNE